MHHLHTQRESTGMHGNDKEKLRRCYYGNEIHRKIFLSTFYPIDNSIVKNYFGFLCFSVEEKKLQESLYFYSIHIVQGKSHKENFHDVNIVFYHSTTIVNFFTWLNNVYIFM